MSPSDQPSDAVIVPCFLADHKLVEAVHIQTCHHTLESHCGHCAVLSDDAVTSRCDGFRDDALAPIAVVTTTSKTIAGIPSNNQIGCIGALVLAQLLHCVCIGAVCKCHAVSITGADTDINYLLKPLSHKALLGLPPKAHNRWLG